jgi:glyoxylase-like metal-dependent hydrolase (beta-lactamase superfamily II)
MSTVLDLPITRSRTLGRFKLHVIEAGMQRLDGGAMFGVVPKPLWAQRIPADERNRIPLALRCLLVETPDALVLIDNGVGNKENDRFHDIYGIENAGEPTRLEDGLRAAGFEPDDVDIMIDTHLHFDHAGSSAFIDDDGQIQLSFPARGTSCRKASGTLRICGTSASRRATYRTTSIPFMLLVSSNCSRAISR